MYNIPGILLLLLLLVSLSIISIITISIITSITINIIMRITHHIPHYYYHIRLGTLLLSYSSSWVHITLTMVYYKLNVS